MPNDEENMREDQLDGEQLEKEWNRALNAASQAVSANTRAHTLSASELSKETAHIQEERRWLTGFRETLRNLFPTRRQSQKK